ncbi:MAG: ABC transporter ATP-binding protein [Methanomassiliicoccaceae archaeon]|nr:ABC transporter ATP-binding protein [Methanomassiliicoccaceae archaeon]
MHLNIDGLGFSYASVPVLDGITLDVSGNELVSILGPNGVGKSTLIHCINKILQPTGGSVFIEGKDVKEVPIKELAKIVGYVPCASKDTFPMTVVDTVLMGRHPHSKWGSLDADLEFVHRTLRLMGVEDLAMRAFNELSAGQHQKVMLARGIAQEPKILLLDEPTSNLDIKHQIEVTRILRDLTRKNGILVIMISHDLNIAAKYSDRVILMHKGTIFSVGEPHEVITEDNLRTVYDVCASVVPDGGRPHVILKDPETPSPVFYDDDIGGMISAEAVESAQAVGQAAAP